MADNIILLADGIGNSAASPFKLFGYATAFLILLLAVAMFPHSPAAIYRLLRFLRGTDVSTGTGTP